MSSLDDLGGAHLAPMGPECATQLDQGFLLKPFKGSKTLTNLMRNGFGVFHLLDDSLLLAQAAVGQGEKIEVVSASTIRGWVLSGACQVFEFEVEQLDTTQERARIKCRVVATHTLRPFGGWNRAQFAVMELAILNSRVAILDKTVIQKAIGPLEVLVQKTGGPREREAWDLLLNHLQMRLASSP